MSDTIPQHIKDKIAAEVEKFSFQIPYDGTNDFYNEDKAKGCEHGAEIGYSLAQQELSEAYSDSWKAIALNEGQKNIELMEGLQTLRNGLFKDADAVNGFIDDLLTKNVMK